MPSFWFLQNSSDQIEKWVLCRIFLKKRNSEIDQACKDDRVENVAVKSHMHRFFYFTRKDNIGFDFVSSSSSSSSSSVITEVSSNGEDLDEESNSSSSSRNIFWPSVIANRAMEVSSFFHVTWIGCCVLRKCILYWKENISIDNWVWIYDHVSSSFLCN